MKVTDILLLSVLSAPLAVCADNLMESATIFIRANEAGEAVNPLIFGHNIEAADTFGIFHDHHVASNDGQGFWNPSSRSSVAEVVERAKEVGTGSLRYPGGCLAHNFDWRDAVGPLEERPDFQFGIDEWIKLCRELGAEPIFTTSDYVMSPEEMPEHLAELVEYLNAPATPEYPWAMKRAQWGNPEPYGVKWFELGNESDHGNHRVVPQRKFMPDEYVKWARECAAAMRKVDPSIKIGTVTVPGDGRNIYNSWNAAVFSEAALFSDFIVVHFYTPMVPDTFEAKDEAAINQSSMAVTDQLKYRIKQYRDEIKKASGRDLPLAVTEFNIGASRNTPFPYRYSHAAGMQSADFIRLALQMQDEVVMTQYWHLINGWWGALETRNGRIEERAPYPLFRLLGQNIGTELVPTEVIAPTAEFIGINGINPAVGNEYIRSAKSAPVALPKVLPTQPISRDSYSIQGGSRGDIIVDFKNHKGPVYQEISRINVPAGNPFGVNWKITYDAKIENEGPGKAIDYGQFGMSLIDGRGWAATHSGIAVMGAEKAEGQWLTISEEFRTLNDADAAQVIVRFDTKKPFTGRMTVRNLKIETVEKDTFPAYPLLTAVASRSADGDKLYLIVFNKSLDETIETKIVVDGFEPASAGYTAVVNEPTALVPADEVHGAIDLKAGAPLLHRFPPCSMTAIVIERKQ